MAPKSKINPMHAKVPHSYEGEPSMAGTTPSFERTSSIAHDPQIPLSPQQAFKVAYVRWYLTKDPEDGRRWVRAYHAYRASEGNFEREGREPEVMELDNSEAKHLVEGEPPLEEGFERRVLQ